MPSELHFSPGAETVWRLVEAQHVVSTTRLVDTLAEQEILEAILERSKPPMPADCTRLHYLMAAPFRYGLYPQDSRFRRKGRTPGVFYASVKPITAAAETVWARLRFFAAAPDATRPAQAAEFTGFSVSLSTARAVDLTKPPMNADRALWTDPDDYSACLALADRARAAGVGTIRYQSVRHPDGLTNVAVLRCATFARPNPLAFQSWRILMRPAGALVFCEHPKQAWEFHQDGKHLRRV